MPRDRKERSLNLSRLTSSYSSQSKQKQFKRPTFEEIEQEEVEQIRAEEDAENESLYIEESGQSEVRGKRKRRNLAKSTCCCLCNMIRCLLGCICSPVSSLLKMFFCTIFVFLLIIGGVIAIVVYEVNSGDAEHRAHDLIAGYLPDWNK